MMFLMINEPSLISCKFRIRSTSRNGFMNIRWTLNWLQRQFFTIFVSRNSLAQCETTIWNWRSIMKKTKQKNWYFEVGIVKNLNDVLTVSFQIISVVVINPSRNKNFSSQQWEIHSKVHHKTSHRFLWIDWRSLQKDN